MSGKMIAILTTATIALMAAGVIQLLEGSPAKSRTTITADKRLAESEEIIQENLKLQAQFSGLQQLDEDFSLLIFNNGDAAAVDSISRLIADQESRFFNYLKKMRADKDKYNVLANAVLSDSIAATFIQALSNRKYLADIRNLLLGKKIETSPDAGRIVKLETELRKKENIIASLEHGTREQQVRQEGDIEVDRSSPQAADVELVASLKKENAKLMADKNQLETFRQSRQSAIAASESTIQKLKDELSDIHAELAFEQIDCSLTRADSRKIISNSKQRTQLLGEALKSLREMAQSSNESVARRAREKLDVLNEIASTVRD